MKDIRLLRKTLRGKSKFIEDSDDSDILHMAIVRSTVPAGRILSIGASALPAGYRLIAASDIPGAKAITAFGQSVPVLAQDEVRYYGEPILIVTGPDEWTTEDIRRSVRIEYEEQPASYGMDDPEPRRVVCRRKIKRGRGFPEQEPEGCIVHSGTYSTATQEHYYGEPQAALAVPGAEELTVTTSSRWPFHVLRSVCSVLALKEKQVRVTVPPDPDMSLDGKLWSPAVTAAQTALAAFLTGKPVKFVLDRQEDFLYSTKRAPSWTMLRSLLAADGTPRALRARMCFDCGAYPVLARELADRAAYALGTLYAIEDIDIEVLAVSTNHPPLGAFTGLGGSQAFFAIETHAAEIAALTGQSPLEWKRRHLRVPKAKRNVPDPRLLAMVDEMSDFTRRHASFEVVRKAPHAVDENPLRRGIGLAFCCQGSGFIGRAGEYEKAAVEIRIAKDGSVELFLSAVPGSSSMTAIWKLLVRERLGLSEAEVFVHPVDTRMVPDSGPAVFSRNIARITELILRCCDALNKKRFRDPLPLSAVKTFRYPSWHVWNAESFSGEAFTYLSWAACAVEIELNRLTLNHRLANICLAIDAGTIIDEEEARKTIERAISQAIGWMFKERINYRNGRIDPIDFKTYEIPSTADLIVPRIEFLPQAVGAPARGLGELALSCVPPAAAAALAQALSGRLRAIPVEPQQLIGDAL